ncbi:hypothetical protein IQ254_12690 [Nodosilinea sp. LEGE 07088]|uniref:hypothetical protein n=1 Tax=Nodosilinea sp. LEGE 07088 TaxID=2777968 RepID=UPI00187EDAF2|nr:hypothetical protein [Nodosilinea sp. LEGE 07088]MBE9138036.1 hypothetical protein [Nodosilinea sp. LEGE 07088]
MPARGEIDITVKFDGVPIATAGSGGITKIEIYCSGYVVLADIKTKTFKRFLEKAMEYDYWEGVVSDRLHHIQGHQLILTHAGIHCREKKIGG